MKEEKNRLRMKARMEKEKEIERQISKKNFTFKFDGTLVIVQPPRLESLPIDIIKAPYSVKEPKLDISEKNFLTESKKEF